ncbi:MAG: RnfABCDGE type electron transport complex subunit B [Lachnospiraceae bacterium]|nr:RnfABCDGE type electron transport complex subunit B [Lachnospiraceae bacterium]
MSGSTLLIVTIILLAIVGLLVGIMLVFAGEKFRVEVDPKEAQVRECLPGNNCGACGYPGCDGLAAAIAKGEAPVNKCPVGGSSVAEMISEIMGVDAGEVTKRAAFVKCSGTCDKAIENSVYVGIETCTAAAAIPGKGTKACQAGCLGFGECTKVCDFDAIHIVNGIAVVDRTKCVGCGRCAEVCPQHLISVIPDNSVYAVACNNHENGKVVRQQCAAGCIGCKLCMRQCEFSAMWVDTNVAHIDYDVCTHCGKCAAKCPQKVIVNRHGAKEA